jgi:hypothetical protein
MKRTLMVSVAALALAAGSTIAMSQGNSGRGEGGAGANAPMNNPAGASGGASGQMNESPAPRRGAQQDRAIPEKQQKSTQQAPDSAQAPATRQSQGERDKAAPTTRQSQGEREKSGTTQQTQSPSATGSKQGTAGTQSGAMRTSNVSLTTEQKTTIRSKVLTGSAPRVTNVNFDIRIGTVVPRTVRIAPVPATLVEIEPTWRGYMYFVYADEIIIVEPRTLEIVYVLAV